MKRTLWFVEDELEILDIYELYAEEFLEGVDYDLKLLPDVSNLTPNQGDVVVHDLCGIGKFKKQDGVTYFCCSGSLSPDDPVDFYKPLDPQSMFNTIKKALAA